VNDRAVVGGADVGLAELVCAAAGQQCGQNACEITFGPVGLAL